MDFLADIKKKIEEGSENKICNLIFPTNYKRPGILAFFRHKDNRAQKKNIFAIILMLDNHLKKVNIKQTIPKIMVAFKDNSPIALARLLNCHWEHREDFIVLFDLKYEAIREILEPDEWFEVSEPFKSENIIVSEINEETNEEVEVSTSITDFNLMLPKNKHSDGIRVILDGSNSLLAIQNQNEGEAILIQKFLILYFSNWQFEIYHPILSCKIFIY